MQAGRLTDCGTKPWRLPRRTGARPGRERPHQEGLTQSQNAARHLASKPSYEIREVPGRQAVIGSVFSVLSDRSHGSCNSQRCEAPTSKQASKQRFSKAADELTGVWAVCRGLAMLGLLLSAQSIGRSWPSFSQMTCVQHLKLHLRVWLRKADSAP